MIACHLQESVCLTILEVVRPPWEITKSSNIIWIIPLILTDEHRQREVSLVVITLIGLTHRVAYNFLAELVNHLPGVQFELSRKLSNAASGVNIACILATGIATGPYARIVVLQQEGGCRTKLCKLGLYLQEHVVDIALSIDTHKNILAILQP